MRALMVVGAAVIVVLAAGGCTNGRPDGPSPVKSVDKADYSKPGPVDADAPEEFTQTSSGLKYRIRRKGTGRRPTAADSVLASYKGWLDDGKEFDSSYKRGEPTPFPLSGVIPGWTEGLQHVSEGGMIELEIPAELGYGAAGQPPDIPPNARLHFLVELHEVR